VRDRYNNPVDPTTVAGGLRANVTNGTGLVERANVRVDSDGRARFEYVGGDGTLTLSVVGRSGAEYDVSLAVTEAGGATESVDGGITLGGTSTYSAREDTVTLASPNGRWESITCTDQFVISNTVLAQNSGGNAEELSTTVRLDSTDETRVLQLTYKSDGTKEVGVTDQNGNENEVSLTSQAASRIGNGNPVDLLNESNYQDTFPELAEIRALSNDDPVTMLVQDQRGRVDVTLLCSADGGNNGDGGDSTGPTNLPTTIQNPNSGEAFDDENLNGVRDPGEKQYNNNRILNGNVPQDVDLAIPSSAGDIRAQNDGLQIEVASINSEVALESETGNVQLTARTGDIRLRDDVRAPNGNIEIDGENVDTRTATIRSNSGNVQITATGAYDATDGKLISQNGNVELTSDGDMTLDRTRVESQVGDVSADLGGPNVLRVDGTTVVEPNGDGVLSYQPSGVTETPDNPDVAPG
jgi:hypothetical protein